MSFVFYATANVANGASARCGDGHPHDATAVSCTVHHFAEPPQLESLLDESLLATELCALGVAT